MPRIARYEEPGQIRHIFNRGVEKRVIFFLDEDYAAFLRFLEKAARRHKISTIAFALIPNHYHLVAQRGADSFGKMMQSVGGRYAIRVNKMMERVGHLFQNRYGATLLNSPASILRACRYVHLNPMKHGVVKRFDDLLEYPWSNLRSVLAANKGRWPEPNLIMELAGNPENYLDFLRSGLVEANQFGWESLAPEAALEEISQLSLDSEDETKTNFGTLSEVVDWSLREFPCHPGDIFRSNHSADAFRTRAAISFFLRSDLRFSFGKIQEILGCSERTARRLFAAGRSLLDG